MINFFRRYTLLILTILLFANCSHMTTKDEIYIKESGTRAKNFKDITRKNGVSYTKKGKLANGLYFQYFENSFQVKDSMNFKDGKLDQEFKAYHRNGNLQMTAFFEDGELTGRLTKYYENGNKKSIETFEDGILHGKSWEFDENENLKSALNFVQGKLTGEAIFYNTDGTIEKTILYK